MVTQIGVNYYKISKRVEEPIRATLNSACYDIKACFHTDSIKVMDTSNNSSYEQVKNTTSYNKSAQASKSVYQYRFIDILPGWRYLIPTGIIFDIPDDYSIRIHPRSGLAWKNGITVANCEGVVDSDYYHETFVMLYNISEKPFTVWEFDRIAQIEFHTDTYMALKEVDTPPEQKTDRAGGFGHTGV